ncbi:DMT family transporter [Staphylococcus saprophyticus]|uniref:DMT superfamily drug/metabolite transporter n=1 Tax=Staphylococcus saprophyticus TaxID=29385 RepID=A0A380HJD8_STASA|nr:DMT family transporter [Staphylococcus saprophyticus]KIJ87955.1 transporter [Staphylococcus saprophyticus]MBF2778132.1 EamA family transporter [Staphylococcus saprophyticus]MBN6094085.1 EamA family transporter [Staphylococcus saprophyticus]MBN6097805.1 EamA family transporter [Staphylococcus saprophyticus]MBN6099953.1 EamA family transporter [Staphylococcus saprophyticus]
MKQQSRFLGIILAILGASFWGLGGTVSDYLFKQQNIDINWYVTARLLISGFLLLTIFKILNPRQSIFIVFRNVTNTIQLLIFSTLGMLLVQYAYMASINYGNAAIATLLQYIAPVYIILWFIILKKETFKLFDVIAILLTLTGTFLLLTNGSLDSLMVSSSSMIWGIISGLSLAFYTIYASNLLSKFPAILVVGWAMLISGILMNFKAPIWQFTISQIDISVILYLAFGIILGTAMAFFFFIKSLNYLSAKETTLFGTIEPVMAIVASALWLKVVFLPFQLLGIVLIIILILALSLKKDKER